jgi:hypothetical protein
MQERLVTPPEAEAIVLKGFRRHRGIAEAWMAFDIGCSSVRDIAPCGGESIMKALPGYLCVAWRRRWLFIYRLRMRTSSQREGQQQGRKGKPFLHIVSSIVVFDVSPDTAGVTLGDRNT